MASDLPQELYTRIYAHLCPRSDLLPCSLVCRAWFLSTRQSPLFRNITISNRNVDEFADLVMNPYSSFPFCIQHLTLDVDPTWFRRVLPFLQPLNATSLRLRNLHWTSIEADTQSKFIAMFSKTIRTLQLGPAMTFEYLVDMTRLISQFSAIETLAMEEVHWKLFRPVGPSSQTHQIDADRRALSMYTLSSTCRSLSFAGCDLGALAQWLYAHSSFPNVQKLSIGGMKLQDIIHFRGICRAAGPLIQELALSFDTGDEGSGEPDSSLITTYEGRTVLQIPAVDDMRPQPSRLSEEHETSPSMLGPSSAGHSGKKVLFSSLTTLRYNDFIYFTDRGRSSGSFFGVKCLTFLAARGAGSTPLQKLTFCIVLQKAGDLDYHNIDWCVFDTVLVSLVDVARQSSCVSPTNPLDYGIRIIFEIGGGANSEATAALIRQKLPQCHRMKAIVFKGKGA